MWLWLGGGWYGCRCGGVEEGVVVGVTVKG